MARIDTVRTALAMLDSSFDDSDFEGNLYRDVIVASPESGQNLKPEEQRMTSSGSDELRAGDEVELLEASARGSNNSGSLLDEAGPR